MLKFHITEAQLLGYTLRYVREKAKLQQKDVYHLFCHSPSNYSRCEGGSAEIGFLSICHFLAKIGLSVDSFLQEIERMKKVCTESGIVSIGSSDVSSGTTKVDFRTVKYLLDNPLNV